MSEQLKIFEQGTCVLFVSKDGEFTWADDADVKLADDSLWKNSTAMRHILLRLRASQSEPASKPVAWVRIHPDGTLSHELLNEIYMEDKRKNNGAWIPLYRLDAVPVNAQTAKQQYVEHMKNEQEPSAIERLRFFLSFALNKQDWLDVEEFIDAISNEPVKKEQNHAE